MLGGTEYREDVIVADTGRGAGLLETGKSYHPEVRWEFRIDREEEIGPQLRALGIGPHDVKRTVLTLLHVDHDGGLAYFPNSETRLRLANFTHQPGGPSVFARSRPWTQPGVAVATSVIADPICATSTTRRSFLPRMSPAMRT
jgi:glyoxylase-like metal-dependent hydrolase (beta-lactamase superfamily II)